MQVTTVENGSVIHRWVKDYALLYRNGKVRARYGSFDEMWEAWKLLNLAWIRWRDETTGASWFLWPN